jgi:hypothetical protein
VLTAVLIIVYFIYRFWNQTERDFASGRKTAISGTYRLQHVQRGSSISVVGNMFLLVNPLAATPLFSPSSLARAALFGLVVYMPRGRTVAPAQDSPKGPVRQCTIGTSPLSIRWWILEVVHSIFSCQRVSPDLSAMASPTLVMDPSDVTRRVVEEQPTGCMAWQPTG